MPWLPLALPAQFAPIALSPQSFNHDVVVERTAPQPLTPVTTASVESGSTNTGFSWFERGYNADWPATGLPSPGTVIQSAFSMDREYQFAPDYADNNGVLIDSTFTHAELALVSPGSVAALSFLLSGTHDSAWAPVAYAVHHADASVETGTIRCKDWLDSTPIYAYTPNGRVNVTTFTFANLNENMPKMFAADIVLTNLSSPVTGVELSYVSGPGHSVIMALSGASDPAGPFGPLRFTGYNADVIVEASATRPQPLVGVTTATMASGSVNSSWTWFESGYVPGATECGLPAAGSQVTNPSAPNQVYVLAPSFMANNAALLEAEAPAINLIPALPVACSTLSFLTASAGGPATNLCVIQHANGSAQTNWLVCPDWLDETLPAVLSAAGRVNVNNRMLDHLNNSGPRLFAADLEVLDSTSEITNILIQCDSTASAHTACFGLSGRTGGAPPMPATLRIRIEAGGSVVIESSAPGRLEYTTALEGADTVWQSAGTIENSLTLAPVDQPGETRFYRVTAP